MKKIKNMISLFLVIALMLSFCSCGVLSGGDVVMRYGDKTLNESDYLYIASIVKDNVVYYYQYYLYQMTGTVYQEADILKQSFSEDGKTVSDYIKEAIDETAKRVLIIEHLCDEAGLTITDESSINEISTYVDELEYAYGGKDLFEIELAKMGFVRSSIERYERYNYLLNLYSDFRYGDNGVAKIPESSVTEKFLSEYFSFEGCIYSFLTEDKDGNNTQYIFDLTDDEIKTYFYENYVKVNHVLYKTVDATGKELSKEEVEKAKSDAESALAAIQSGEKTLDDFKHATDDSGYTYTFTKGKMVKEFEELSFDLEIGAVGIAKTQYGYHVIEKLELSDTDLFGTTDADGNTKGSIKVSVAAAMSADKIRFEANECFEKLKSGELDGFVKEDKDYYFYEKPAVTTDGKTNYSDLEKAIKDAKVGEYILKEISNDGVFIVKKLELKADDITEEIYSTIEDTLINDAFYQYILSFNDDIEINNEVISRFDVASIPALDDNFYS